MARTRSPAVSYDPNCPAANLAIRSEGQYRLGRSATTRCNGAGPAGPAGSAVAVAEYRMLDGPGRAWITCCRPHDPASSSAGAAAPAVDDLDRLVEVAYAGGVQRDLDDDDGG